jgi:hypothetical protein
VDLPARQRAFIGPTVFNTRLSKDLAADTVILYGSGSEVRHGIIVEAQQERLDKKRAQLPRYAAALWLERECPVNVIVICPDKATAAWYAKPIPTTVPGFTFLPRALYPERVPAFTTPEQAAANPPMAVLSVAFHGLKPGVTDAFIEGMGSLGVERGPHYYEFGWRMSPKAIGDLLEELVTRSDHWPVYSPLAKEHYGKGLAEGEERGRAEDARESVLSVLDSPRPEGDRERTEADPRLRGPRRAQGMAAEGSQHRRGPRTVQLDPPREPSAVTVGRPQISRVWWWRAPFGDTSEQFGVAKRLTAK